MHEQSMNTKKALYGLSEEEQEMLDLGREFAEKQVAPRAAEIDQTGQYPWDLKEQMANLDIMAMPFPPEYKGTGASELLLVMTIEELARSCATTSLILAAQLLAGTPIMLFGNESQKQKYLPPLAKGEWLAAYALTEPEAGSDAAAMRTTAVRKGDMYLLNGVKHFITNGGLAQVNVVFARTDSTAGTKGISAFLVDKYAPGFSVGKAEHKMGIRGSQTTELVFVDCEVPAENLLGQEGEGFKIAMATLDRTRPGVAAQALGIAQGAFDFAVDYVKTRTQFGKPIADQQGIQFMIAEMAADLEAARLLVYRAAMLIDRSQTQRDLRFSQESAMSKMFASEKAVSIVDKALQLLGGYGYMTEYPLERMYRDVRITPIYEGTNQIQRAVIARGALR
jgi:alkylation response protein AidB-like acyl-CoA dehydrogenase